MYIKQNSCNNLICKYGYHNYDYCKSKHQTQKVARVVEQLCIITSVYTIVYQGMLKHAPMVIAEVNFHEQSTALL